MWCWQPASLKNYMLISRMLTLIFWCGKEMKACWLHHPYLQEVLIWDKKDGKLKDLRRLLHIIRGKHYDKVINVQRFAATGMLTAFSMAAEKIGFDKNPLSALFTTRVKHIISTKEHPKHEIERNNDLIAHFTDNKAFKPRLYPSAADYTAVEKYKHQPYICIAPSSVWFTKQYPANKWTALYNNWIAVQHLSSGCSKQIKFCVMRLSMLAAVNSYQFLRPAQFSAISRAHERCCNELCK